MYRAKRKATDLITGDEKLQYGKLRDYAEMIRMNDKGSRVILQTEWKMKIHSPDLRECILGIMHKKLVFGRS